MERTMTSMNAEDWNVWWIGKPEENKLAISSPLPYGSKLLGASLKNAGEVAKLSLPENTGLYLHLEDNEPISEETLPGKGQLVLTITNTEQLDEWVKDENVPSRTHFEVHLTQETGAWMIENREIIESKMKILRIHQPTHEQMKAAIENDFRNPKLFFEALNLPVEVSGLPACMTPGATIVEPTKILRGSLFSEETGRIKIQELASYHVSEHYRSKSIRCRDCAVNDRCDGQHINMIRDQGLRILTPLVKDEWSENAKKQMLAIWPEPQKRIALGMKSQKAPISLEGFAQPSEVQEDPLAVIERKRAERKERMKARAARSAAAKKKKNGESGLSPTHA